MKAYLLVFSLIFFVPCVALAQENLPPLPPLNGFQAGQEAAARTRQGLLVNLARQIGLNDALRQRAAVAVPSLPPGVVQQYPAAPVIGWSGPVGSGFAFGFSPWAGNPGMAWRIEIPPWAQVRQSIGQEERQVGPTRWESRPIYMPDAIPEAIPSPPPLSPDSPPIALPPSPGGVREF